MNLKDRKVKSKLWIHSKRPDKPAIKRRKTNPTGTRTTTRQISPGNPSKKTQEGAERPVREKIIYYHHKNEGKKHAWKHPLVVKLASQEQTTPPHAMYAHTHTQHNAHTYTHTCTHTQILHVGCKFLKI